jgi:carbon-monoxide dehydrogenase large subunit
VAEGIITKEGEPPFNPEGIKGAGEGGTIAAIPTLVSAVEDALAPFDVTINDVPITGEELVRLVDREG